MIQLNEQPTESLDRREDGSLDVIGYFRTIQGEGPYAGCPAVFVRLAGCNMQCPSCDTIYTGPARQWMDPARLAEAVFELCGHNTRLVVLTGGEPLRQNVTPFACQILQRGLILQLETNGTLNLEPFPWASPSLCVVCSPKAPKVHPEMVAKIHYWKYVLRAGFVSPEDGLPTDVLGSGLVPARPVGNMSDGWRVFVQPEDDQDERQNKINLHTALQSSLKFGYRVGVQMHKILGVD